MTFPISLPKLLKKEMGQTAWLPILICIFAFFLYPLRFLMSIQTAKEYPWLYTEESGRSLARAVQEIAESVFGTGDILTLMALTVAAILCAVVTFSYIDSRDRIDLYHSLPIRREKLYAVAFLRGSLSAILPYLFFTTISFFGIGAVNGAVTAKITGVFLRGISAHLLAFIAIYAVCVLGMTLTGRLLTGLLMSGFLLGFGPVCYLLFWNLVNANFHSYWNTGSDYTVPVRLLSPLVDVVGLSGLREEGSRLPEILILAGWALAAFLISLWLYKRRPSESAENAMVHPYLEGIIKVAVIIPGALLFGLLLSALTNTAGQGWFIGGTLIGAILLNGILEFIYRPDLRNIGKHWKSGLAGVGAATALMVFLVADPIGYDRWLPETSAVEAMAMISPDQGWYYGNTYAGNTEMIRKMLPAHATTEFANLYELAKEGASGSANQEGEVYYPYDAEEAVEGGILEEHSFDPVNDVIVYFRLKGGREVFRQYQVHQSTVEKTMRTLLQDPAQASWLIPVNQLKVENLRDYSIGYWDETTEEGEYKEENLDLSTTEVQELTQHLQNDMNKSGLDMTSEEEVIELFPVYTKEEAVSENGPYLIWSFYLRAEYTETMQYLEERGIQLP